jgi:predicted RNA-binding Zn-ribbon protein involved in translation (DUF1610 family)
MKNQTTIAAGSHISFQNQTALVLSAKAGWLELEFPDKSTTKARSGKCTLLPMHEAIAETLEAEKQALEPAPESEVPAATERSWLNDDQIEVFCPECEHVWTPKRLKLSIQCPKCGAWVKVRIKADLTHYIRGLGVTPSGHDTLDIGDGTADILRGLTAAEAIDVTAVELVRLGIETMSKSFVKAFRKAIVGGSWCENNLRFFLSRRYENRNNGMVRMNCGNILRAAQIRANGSK